MTELRPQLGVTLPTIQTKFLNDDDTINIDWYRSLERLKAMLANDEIFMQEVMQETKDGEIDDLRAQLELLVAATNEAIDAANQAAADAENAAAEAANKSDDQSLQIAQELDDALALIASRSADEEALAPRGALAQLDQADNADIVGRALGIDGVVSDASTNWYTAGGTPSRAKADYDTLTFNSPLGSVEVGARLKVDTTYVQRGILNMFEAYAWTEEVEIRDKDGTLIVSLATNNRDFKCSTSTDIPGGWDVNLDFVKNFGYPIFLTVPAFTGAWATAGTGIKARLILTPLGAFNSGVDCIAGGTLDAALIASDYLVKDMSVQITSVTDGATQILD